MTLQLPESAMAPALPAAALPCAGRRRLLQAGAAWLALPAVAARAQAQAPAKAHAPPGPVQPALAAPALRLTPSSGPAETLPALLKGRVTALQLMFTGCSATCPIQGAMFAEVQRQLAAVQAPADWRLLSVSIDPLSDGAPQLKAWLERFGAQPARWRAAAPDVKEVDTLFNFLQGETDGVDRHSSQVFVFDRQAALAWRTLDLPSLKQVMTALQNVASR